MGSKNARHKRKCRSKRSWDNEDHAYIAARKMRQQNPGQVFDAYRCQFCGSFHVGHRPHRVHRSMKSRRK